MQRVCVGEKRKQALMKSGKLSSLVPKLNVFKSNYFDSISVFDDKSHNYLTVREPSGTCKFRCRSVKLRQKRIFDLETLYFKIFEKCMEYNHCFSNSFNYELFEEEESEFRNELQLLNKQHSEKLNLKLILLCCRVFFDQVQHEWEMDFSSFHHFLNDNSAMKTKIKSGEFLDRLMDIMIEGRANFTYFENSRTLLKCYEGKLIGSVFKKHNVFINLYLSLMIDFSFDIHTFFVDVMSCNYFNHSVFMCMVFGFLFDIPCKCPDEKSVFTEIQSYCNNLYCDNFESVDVVPGPAYGDYSCDTNEDLLDFERNVLKLFSVSEVFNYSDTLINASIITQLRTVTIGLNFDNGTLYRFAMYLVYFKKFFNYVVRNLLKLIEKERFSKTFCFRARDKYRNENLTSILHNLNSHERLINEWHSGTGVDEQVHSYLSPFVDEERFLWSSAILPFFIELMFIEASQYRIIAKIGRTPHVGGK